MMNRFYKLFSFALIAILAVAALLSMSNLDKWPWVVTENPKSVPQLGVSLGQSKETVFRILLDGIDTNVIRYIELLSTDKTRARITASDQALVTQGASGLPASNEWQISFVSKNEWMILSFSSGSLSSITQKRYRGPQI